jgi:hypothetical protein
MIEKEGLDNILARHHYRARESGAPVRAERSVTLKTTAPSEPQQRENRAHRNQGRGFGDRGNSVRHRFNPCRCSRTRSDLPAALQ